MEGFENNVSYAHGELVTRLESGSSVTSNKVTINVNGSCKTKMNHQDIITIQLDFNKNVIKFLSKKYGKELGTFTGWKPIPLCFFVCSCVRHDNFHFKILN